MPTDFSLRLPGSKLASLTVPTSFVTLLFLASCVGGGGGAGGGVPVFVGTGGAPGSGCAIDAASTVCNGANVVKCDAGTKLWVLVVKCEAGTVCNEAVDPANAALKKATCIASGGGAQDAGGAGGPDTQSTGGDADAGSTLDAGSSGGGVQDSYIPPDTGSSADTGSTDVGTKDSGPVDAGAPDAGPFDAGKPDTGAGDIGADAQPTGSCSGKCGKYQQGASCQCDADCEKYGDCCPDKNQVCGGGGSCQMPMTFSSSSQRFTALQIPPKTTGCDMTGNGQINNALGGGLSAFSAQVNGGLKDAIASGDLVLLLHPQTWTTSGGVMTIEILTGSKSGVSYYATKDSFDAGSSAAVCPATNSLKDAKVKGGTLTGTSKTPFKLPLDLAGVPLNLEMKQLKVSAQVSGASSWQSSSNGLLCGVVLKSDIDKAIDAVPDAELQKLGFDKATLKTLMGGVLKPDIDTTGSGKMDGVSAAMTFTTTKQQISGVQ